METQESIRDEKAEQKYQKWLVQRGDLACVAGRTVSPWVKELRTRVTRWSCQFIRWLVDALTFNWRWADGIAKLRALMLAYLR